MDTHSLTHSHLRVRSKPRSIERMIHHRDRRERASRHMHTPYDGGVFVRIGMGWDGMGWDGMDSSHLCCCSYQISVQSHTSFSSSVQGIYVCVCVCVCMHIIHTHIHCTCMHLCIHDNPCVHVYSMYIIRCLYPVSSIPYAYPTMGCSKTLNRS